MNGAPDIWDLLGNDYEFPLPEEEDKCEHVDVVVEVGDALLVFEIPLKAVDPVGSTPDSTTNNVSVDIRFSTTESVGVRSVTEPQPAYTYFGDQLPRFRKLIPDSQFIVTRHPSRVSIPRPMDV